MIPDEIKISIAMDLIEDKIGKCMAKKRKDNKLNIEEEFNKLLFQREEVYKGNYDVINKIINEAGGNNND